MTAIPGTAGAQPPGSLVRHGAGDAAPHRESRVFVTIQPRLLDVAGAAGFLGVGVDLVRGLIEAGELRPVRVPRPATLREHRRGARSAEIRRTLLDVRDLDALVERWRGAR